MRLGPLQGLQPCLGPYSTSQETMRSQEFSVTRNMGRPRGRTRPETATVRVPVELLQAFDAWISAQPEPQPFRSEVIRRALADHLRAKGYLLAEV